jgi:hypothetical protein
MEAKSIITRQGGRVLSLTGQDTRLQETAHDYG